MFMQTTDPTSLKLAMALSFVPPLMAMCFATRRLYTVPALFELFADQANGLGGLGALVEANERLATI